jgi:hypothetical protein
VDPGETFIARKGFDKHVSTATKTQATIEGLLGNGVFCWVCPEPNITRTPEERMMIERVEGWQSTFELCNGG